jgi:hypothetical protein
MTERFCLHQLAAVAVVPAMVGMVSEYMTLTLVSHQLAAVVAIVAAIMEMDSE